MKISTPAASRNHFNSLLFPTLDARGFSLLGRRNTTKRREKPLVQAFENLTSMPRVIDIEKTSMRDITYQSASLVPTVHLSYLGPDYMSRAGVSLPGSWHLC